MTTKAELLTAFERELKARYAWTKDAEKLARFMRAAHETLATGAFKADLSGPAWEAALKSVGLSQDVTWYRLIDLDP